MSVTEKLMAAGTFNLQLDKKITPNTIINTIDAWGHIIIVPGDLNVQEFSDTTLLNASKYTGIVQSLELGDDDLVSINGQGLIAYLGTSDTTGMPIATTGGPSGVRSYKNKTLEDVLDYTGSPKGLLRKENGNQGPIRKGTITEPTDGSKYTGKHYTESALKAIKYVCQDLDVEFKVDNKGYLSAGPITSLFSGHDSDPTTIIFRGASGEDPNISGVATTSLVAQFDASEFVSSVELVASKYGAEANVGSANVSSNPYKDLFGDALSRTQYVSDPQTEGTSKTERATQYLNELNTLKKTINVSLEEYDISGDFVVGDKIFIFDPDIGFIDTETDRIEEGRSSLFETVYQGQIVNPTKIRILGVTWPVKQGYGVFYRDKDGNYIELTDYMMWENGDVQLEIGDVAPTMGETLGMSGYSLDAVGSPDKSVPDQPLKSDGTVGINATTGSYSDGNGISKAFIKVSWNQPNNTDGSTITDGSFYRIRWRVVQDSDGNNIIDANDDQATEYVYSTVEFDTRQFIIYDLSPNTYYELGVQTVDLAGFDSAYSSITSFQTTADSGAPNKPDGFATIASNPLRVQFIHNLGQAKDNDGNAVSPVVNFTLAKDIDHLNIYGSTTQGFDLEYNSTTKKVTQSGYKLGELKASSSHIQNEIAAVGYIDLDNADTHYFRVTAVDTSGNESEPSDEQSGNADLIQSQNIANLAVTNALIANAAITDAKVANLSAGKITAGTISGQTIILAVSGDTGDSSIIKSSNYSAGSTGWAINSDGSAEFRDATIRGSLNASDITTGTLSSDRLDTSYIAVGGAAGDVNSGTTTISGGKITASSIEVGKLDFTPLQDGDDITEGSVAGITITSSALSSTNYPTSGFSIGSDGNAVFQNVTARGTISGSVDTTLSAGGSGYIQSGTGANRLRFGAGTGASVDFIYDSGTVAYIQATNSSTFEIRGYGSGDNIKIQPGGTTAQGSTTLKQTNLYIEGDSFGSPVIHIPNSTQIYVGGSANASSGDVLTYTTNGVQWQSTSGHSHGNLSFPNSGTVLSDTNHNHSNLLDGGHLLATDPHTQYVENANHSHSNFLTGNHSNDTANVHGLNNKANNAALDNKANAAVVTALSSEFNSHVGDNNHGGLSNTHVNTNDNHNLSHVNGLNTALAAKASNTHKHGLNANQNFASTDYVNLAVSLHVGSYHSDERFKENINDLGFGLDFLKLLKPREFTFTEDYIQEYVFPGEGMDEDYLERNRKVYRNTQQGFIAQEVQKAVYEYTGTNNNFSGVSFATLTKEEEDKYGDSGIGRIDPSKIIPVLVKSVQELAEMVELLQARVDELEEI